MSEYKDPLIHIDHEMARKAKEYLNAPSMVPDVPSIEASPDARRGLLRFLHKQLFDIGSNLNEELDPYYSYARLKTVLAFPSDPGDDMLTIESKYLTMQPERGVMLWPLVLLEQEATPYAAAFIDPRGRIFADGYSSLDTAANQNQQFLPTELPMNTMRAIDALAFHQAAEELHHTLKHIRKHPKN